MDPRQQRALPPAEVYSSRDNLVLGRREEDATFLLRQAKVILQRNAQQPRIENPFQQMVQQQ